MSKVWPWLAGIAVALLIVGLVLVQSPTPHRRGAVIPVIRSAQSAQSPATSPPGAWLTARRIPRPNP